MNFMTSCRHSVAERSARPLSGSLSGQAHSKPRLPPISDRLDLAMEGSHHPVFWEEDISQENEEDPSSSEELEEKESVKQYENKEEENVSKPVSEETTPEEDDDIFAQSSKIFIEICLYNH